MRPLVFAAFALPALLSVSQPTLAEAPLWAINGVQLGMPFDEVKSALEPKGQTGVARQARSDGNGSYDRAIVLYEPNKDGFRHVNATTAVTAVLFDETGQHRAVEIMKKTFYVAGGRPSPAAVGAAVFEAYGVRLQEVSNFGRIGYAATSLFDRNGQPTQNAKCRATTESTLGGISIDIMLTWPSLDDACGWLLSIKGEVWNEPGVPNTLSVVDQHAIDTVASLADVRKKAAIRQGADAASQAAARTRADGVKPAL